MIMLALTFGLSNADVGKRRGIELITKDFLRRWDRDHPQKGAVYTTGASPPSAESNEPRWALTALGEMTAWVGFSRLRDDEIYCWVSYSEIVPRKIYPAIVRAVSLHTGKTLWWASIPESKAKTETQALRSPPRKGEHSRVQFSGDFQLARKDRIRIQLLYRGRTYSTPPQSVR